MHKSNIGVRVVAQAAFVWEFAVPYDTQMEKKSKNLDLFVLSEDKKSEAFQIAAICYLKTKSESLSLAKKKLGYMGTHVGRSPFR
ncbi:hypothetical protein CEXT_28021 [Caerostris extrusa]|uniref:Uncharacterized protein n=1 Tax=Caerostris extrusa TaxID=172846 RepID=A0AAV4NFR6_CAEEX|nr:hypothetical protein CEXT_28021 [Caerostris extrusa]